MISVLLVDDEPDLLTIGRLFLEKTGNFTIHTSETAAHAINLIKTGSFDVIVSDYQMPEMNGISFLKTIRSQGNTIPFILFTGRGREEVVIEALNNGASFYLQKGGDPKTQFAELSHAIIRTVSHQRAEEDLKRKNEELQSAYEEIAATEEELRSNLEELMKHEEDLRNSQNFLTCIIDQSPHPIWISDEKGTLIRLNQACCDLLIISPDEVVGKYNLFQDTIVQEQGHLPLLRSVFEEGKSVSFYLDYDTSYLKSIPLKQSTFVTLNVSVFPIRDSSGRITNAVIQHIDFTQQKNAEMALHETNALFNAFMNHSPVYIYIKEVTPTESRVVQVSNNFVKMVGIPARDMLGKTMEDLFPPEFAEKMTADDWNVVSKGEILEVRENLNGIDYFSIKFPIVLGKKTLLAGYTIDITEFSKKPDCFISI